MVDTHKDKETMYFVTASYSLPTDAAAKQQYSALTFQRYGV